MERGAGCLLSLPLCGARGRGAFVGGELNTRAAVFPVSVVTQQDGAIKCGHVPRSLFCWLCLLEVELTALQRLRVICLFLNPGCLVCVDEAYGSERNFTRTLGNVFYICGHLTLQSRSHYAQGICAAGLCVSAERWYKGEKQMARYAQGACVSARERWSISHFVQIKKK